MITWGTWGCTKRLLRMLRGSFITCAKISERDSSFQGVQSRKITPEAKSGGTLTFLPITALLESVCVCRRAHLASSSNPLWCPPPTNKPQENPDTTIPFSVSTKLTNTQNSLDWSVCTSHKEIPNCMTENMDKQEETHRDSRTMSPPSQVKANPGTPAGGPGDAGQRLSHPQDTPATVWLPQH